MLIFSSGAFAKKWANNIGVGVSVAGSFIGVNQKDADDIFQLGYGAEVTYIGVHENGLSAKANISVGVETSKDIALQDREVNVGAFENIVLGVGYSFVNSERLLLSVFATAGVEMGQYSFTEEDVVDGNETYDVTTTRSFVTLSAGTDIFAVYRLSQKLGIFANLGARYIFNGNESRETLKDGRSSKRGEHKNNSPDKIALFGKFIVQPTIGVVWTF